MIEMYLRLFFLFLSLNEKRLCESYFRMGLSQTCPRLHIPRVIVKSKGGMIEVTAACSDGPSGPWGLQRSPEAATGLGPAGSRGGATWGSTNKATRETWVANFLFGNWNANAIIYLPALEKGKVVQLCNPFNSHTLPWVTMASHSSDPWLGSPKIRHVPIERILSEAVYAPIKNKENRLYQQRQGKSFSNSSPLWVFSDIYTSEAIADQNWILHCKITIVEVQEFRWWY